MKKQISTFVILLSTGLFLASCNQRNAKEENTSHQETNGTHEAVTINSADDALAEMKAGNQRFLDGKPVNTDYKSQIEHTKNDQHPHTLVLSCLDSRIPPEIIFDQGIGNIFVARVAGNVEDANILGSMEFATKVKGTKLIIVMGHNKCGAVKGAIDHAELGNLTQLVNQIKPAIVGDTTNLDNMLNETSKNNVKMTIADILKSSPVISDMVKENKVKIVGAYYDISTGQVSFLE